MGSSQGLFLVVLKDNIEKQCCSFFWWVKWSLQKGNDQPKTTQPKNSRIRNRTKSRLDSHQGSSQQTILFIVSPRIISPFIRTMSTKKELQEIASYVASLSESQGKWPGHLNIPCENMPWILEPHNHPNSVDLSSFSQAVGSVSQGPTNTQLAEQLTPTSHKTPIPATRAQAWQSDIKAWGELDFTKKSSAMLLGDLSEVLNLPWPRFLVC